MKRLVVVVSLALIASVRLAHAATNITVITDHTHPVSDIGLTRNQGITIQVLYLDAPQRLLARVNRDLPADPKMAATATRQRMRAIGAARFKSAYAALQIAVRYQLKQYPAIIFDQRAIVVGVRDLSEALDHYNRWRNTHSQVQQ